MRTQIDYRDFISSLEKDDSTKEIPFIKKAVLLREFAKNCCKCNRKQNVQKFKDFVFGADAMLSEKDKQDIKKLLGEIDVIQEDQIILQL